MRFSVLIPTYDRAGQLPGLLQAWAGVEPPRGGYEIVLADDGSPSSPRGIVESLAGGLPLRLLLLKHGGVAATRQAALEEARGEFVLITDDDCRPSPGLLRAYEEAVPRFPGRALGGPVVNLLPDNIFSETTQTVTTFVTEAWNSGAGGPLFFTGSNLVFPRAPVEGIGGFHRGWTCRTGEDRDLCRRWAENGGRMAFVADAVMGHAHALGFRSFLRQHFHYGQGRAWSERRRSHPAAGPPGWSGAGFYARLLLHPWRRFSPWKAARITMLIACAQMATAAGSLQVVVKSGHGGI